ncbi:hypothetical protein BTW08_02820 [Salinicola sp. MH3R3-1]|uniref:PEP-CTERM/exosortase system-associated acyltransferase n=1 Tax=Salinicola sp. MH3R3-1 TaxID=1928762 RepID=UPI00094E1033|nr:PEP-CTERM/exosortase system-associated acyltransferase [Salinicola sp. MH3R3-1]OLO09157.1 hypothetical protein BTW08_02820 [Salinicola sp. MH3R3-1]
MSDDFFSVFRIVFAATEDERRQAFLLRHQVYCEELGYEPIDKKNQIETDEFDRQSLHCLIEHRVTGLTAGCMRIVFPDRVGVDGYRLPIEEHCREHGIGINVGFNIHPDSLCEISRVAIPRYFRSGKFDESALSYLGNFVFSDQERRLFPLIGISLFLCATAFTGLIKRHHVLAMMENRFQRLLARSGITFSQVGGSIEFRGRRAAFYIDQRCAEKEMRDSIRPLYRSIQGELSRQFLEKGGRSKNSAEHVLCKTSI